MFRAKRLLIVRRKGLTPLLFRDWYRRWRFARIPGDAPISTRSNRARHLGLDDDNEESGHDEHNDVEAPHRDLRKIWIVC